MLLAVPLMAVSYHLQRKTLAKAKTEHQQALQTDPAAWMHTNRPMYDLGQQSVNWLPWLGSWRKLSAYQNPVYEMGLEAAKLKKDPAKP